MDIEKYEGQIRKKIFLFDLFCDSRMFKMLIVIVGPKIVLMEQIYIAL